MNKFIKLPLFLGVVGALCGGILATTNYFTEPKIKADEDFRANEAFLAHFEEAKKFSQEIDLTDALTANGITQKKYAYNDSNKYIGTIYSCTIAGFGGEIVFTVSFSNGDINKFIATSYGGESSGYGKDYIENLQKNPGEYDVKPGVSMTSTPVNKTITGCLADYTSEYTSIPDFAA